MVKHFIGFSQPEQGLNTGPVQGGERHLRTTSVMSVRNRESNLTFLQLVSVIQAVNRRRRSMEHHERV